MYDSSAAVSGGGVHGDWRLDRVEESQQLIPRPLVGMTNCGGNETAWLAWRSSAGLGMDRDARWARGVG